MTAAAPEPADLLAWYDRHARALPWRVAPHDRAEGVLPDPYRVWLSEIMLQQTTVPHAAPYFLRFTERWPTVADLAAAEDADVMAAWAGLGYYARARNLLKCARVVASDHAGRFPDTLEGLRALPGVGAYTAAAVAAIAFDRPETVVDGNVERVMARLHAVETPLPAAKPILVAHAEALTPPERPGDYAQAVMDLGATICTPRSPACGICPWQTPCAARASGLAPDLPRKTPKKAKPTRLGAVFVAVDPSGALLLETRPPSGLLGGMPAPPTTEWSEEGPADPLSEAPFPADWRRLDAEARHVFTHFSLSLTIFVATAEEACRPARGSFVPRARAQVGKIPTAFAKALRLALPELGL